MKKRIQGMSLILCACLLVGCSAVTDAYTQGKAFVTGETQEEEGGYIPPEGTTQVTGMVLTAYGNEITIQLAEETAVGSGMSGGDASGEGATQGGMGNRGEMAQSELSENMPENVPEDMTTGDRSEGMTGSGMDNRENIAEGQMGDRTQMSGEDATGQSSGTRGDMAMNGDGTVTGQQSNMTSGGTGMMGGDMPENMSGGMPSDMGATAGANVNGQFTLSDETQLFVVPTGTVVAQYGFEMTFSQLTAEQYVTITLSEEGTVLYIEVLG